MNICFFMGKVISDIDYKFILNGKNDAIAFFTIKLLNNSIINAIAYNQKADYCYRTVKIGSDVIIEGNLNSKLNVIITSIYTNK